MRKFEEIGLDWDYYNYRFLKNNTNNIIEKILKPIYEEYSVNNVKLYVGKKGLNVIIELNQPISFSNLILARLNLGDDLFRIRADINKAMNKKEHRINRIWDTKEETVKQERDYNITNFESFKACFLDAMFVFKQFEDIRRAKIDTTKQNNQKDN